MPGLAAFHPLKGLPYQKYRVLDARQCSPAAVHAISRVGDNTMWRIIVPFLQFAIDCLLCLAAFALLSTVICGLWETASWRRHRGHDSFMM